MLLFIVLYLVIDPHFTVISLKCSKKGKPCIIATPTKWGICCFWDSQYVFLILCLLINMFIVAAVWSKGCFPMEIFSRTYQCLVPLEEEWSFFVDCLREFDTLGIENVVNGWYVSLWRMTVLSQIILVSEFTGTSLYLEVRGRWGSMKDIFCIHTNAFIINHLALSVKQH